MVGCYAWPSGPLAAQFSPSQNCRSPLDVGDVVECRLRGLLARVVPGSLVGAREPQPDHLG